MSYFLAQSLDDIDAYLLSHTPTQGVIGHDTETTGLNTHKDTIVGMSFSLTEESGIYVPLHHKRGKNVKMAPAVERFANAIEQNEWIVSYFNAKFDRTFTFKDCGWVPRVFRDVQEAAYLDNCEQKSRGLKDLSKRHVGFDMVRFEELFTAEERRAKEFIISTKLPERCTAYACSDADATLRLDHFFDPIWNLFTLPIKVDTKLVDLIAEMEYEGGLELNHDYVKEQIGKLQWRRKALEAVIYRMTGKKFKIRNAKAVGELLFNEMGLKHPIPNVKQQRGKSGQWVTSADVLEKMASQSPLPEYIITYRKVAMALSGPLSKLAFLHEHDIKPRFTLNQYVATTFRLSAPGGDPMKDGKSGCNAQAIGKGTNRDLLGVELSARGRSKEYLEALEDEDLLVDLSAEFGDADAEVVKTLLDNGEHTAQLRKLPYVVETDRVDNDTNKSFIGLACFRDICTECPAVCERYGIDVTRRLVKDWRVIPSVRQAFRAPKGKVLVSLDYDRQEIVIAANLSGEPTWLNALMAKDSLERDIHAQTAMQVGEYNTERWLALPEYTRKDLRETGKRLNFGTLFQATPGTLARRMDIPLAKAEEIWDSYRQGLPVLFEWISNVIADAKGRGYTRTYFGRRRPLAQFFQSNERGIPAYGERCAVNTWIQGTGADATRIAMVKIDAACRLQQIDRETCRLGLQIHDELMYLVDAREVDAVVPVLQDAMEFNIKRWKVQLETGVKVGEVWGKQQVWEIAA